MSHLITNLCKWLELPPTPKNVLMALSDIANDKGEARPSQTWVGIWTGYKRTAIISAIKSLESGNIVRVKRSPGLANRTEINADLVASQILHAYRTGPYAELVRKAVEKWNASKTAAGREMDYPSPPDERETSEPHNAKRQDKELTRPSVKRKLPDDWLLGPELTDWAAKERPDVDVAQCAKLFRSHYKATGDVRSNWNEAFKAWVLRERAMPSTAQPNTAATPGRDPTLVKIEEDAKRAVQPDTETRAKLQAIRDALLQNVDGPSKFTRRPFQQSDDCAGPS